MSRRASGQQDSTGSISPSMFSAIVSTSRVRSFAYALAGCRYMLRWQKNIRIQLAATIVVVLLALWLDVPALELSVLVLTIAMIWLAEFINGAIEAIVNLASPEFHPMAKVAKDVAAGAVLLAAAASVIVGALLLGPPLFERLGLALAGV